jgi:hypothetical protein
MNNNSFPADIVNNKLLYCVTTTCEASSSAPQHYNNPAIGGCTTDSDLNFKTAAPSHANVSICAPSCTNKLGKSTNVCPAAPQGVKATPTCYGPLVLSQECEPDCPNANGPTFQCLLACKQHSDCGPKMVCDVDTLCVPDTNGYCHLNRNIPDEGTNVSACVYV